MTVRTITEPSVEPVTLQEVKDWLRIDADLTDSGQDSLLAGLIKGLREHAENLTGRAFIQRELELTLPAFPPGGVIELPYPPLVSVSSVKFIDYSGNLVTVDPAEYEVDTYREPALVQPAYLQSWAGTRNVFNAVQVRYVAGYAAGAGSPTGYRENVPGLLKAWMQARIATLWDHRAHMAPANLVQLPRDFADGLLDSLVIATRVA